MMRKYSQVYRGVHALRDVGVIGVHPQLARARRRLPAHFHVEETLGVAASAIEASRIWEPLMGY